MTDHHLDEAILRLLAARRPGATICPSEAAREIDGEHWRGLMGAARVAAGRLQRAGEIDVLQRGQRVDPLTAHGPIRLRKA